MRLFPEELETFIVAVQQVARLIFQNKERRPSPRSQRVLQNNTISITVCMTNTLSHFQAGEKQEAELIEKNQVLWIKIIKNPNMAQNGQSA